MRTLITVGAILLTAGVALAGIQDRVKKEITGHKFSGRIDDTRDKHVAGIWVGQVGVEYLLDDAHIEAKAVTIADVGETPFGNTDKHIKVRAHITGGKYREKHFRGVGNEYHEKRKQETSAMIEFLYILDKNGFRMLEAKKVSHSGTGRTYEMLERGAGAKILERLKAFK